jgi:choline kinase
MLAAGIGDRLGRGPDAPPKVLLEFGGKTLLERHLSLLRAAGTTELTIVVGHQALMIERAIARLGAASWVRTLPNPDYRGSSLLSLWTLREVLAGGTPLLYMDADVLYDSRLLARLLATEREDALLVDRDVEDGDDPLKVCMQDGRIVDFHKRISAPAYDYWTEWVGFARFSAASAARLVSAIEAYVERGQTGVIYEEPIRDVILSAAEPGFAAVEITGLPWIEIDFPEDLLRARAEILPRLVA